MKIFITLLLFTGSSILLQAQNVGIGNPSPAEKLDVTGNINVTGTIKANGVDGTANQVLMKNSSGVLQWSDLSEFKNFSTYYGDGTFTVPAGITTIAVEIWGAGGAGNSDAGGGGGGYLFAKINVVPGSVGTVDVGTGGAGANGASGGSGDPSSFSISSILLTATGGTGAGFLTTTNNLAGNGGGFPQLIPGVNSFVGVRGTPGNALKRNFQQFSATVFYETTDGGNGGFAYNAPEGAGQGSRIVFNLTGSATVQFVGGSNDGHVPGGGGSSGLKFGPSSSVPGGNGGNGLVIVHY